MLRRLFSKPSHQATTMMKRMLRPAGLSAYKCVSAIIFALSVSMKACGQ